MISVFSKVSRSLYWFLVTVSTLWHTDKVCLFLQTPQHNKICQTKLHLPFVKCNLSFFFNVWCVLGLVGRNMLAAQASEVFLSSTNPLHSACCQKQLLHVVPYLPQHGGKSRDRWITTADQITRVLPNRGIKSVGLGPSLRSELPQGAVRGILPERPGALTRQGTTHPPWTRAEGAGWTAVALMGISKN